MIVNTAPAVAFDAALKSNVPTDPSAIVITISSLVVVLVALTLKVPLKKLATARLSLATNALPSIVAINWPSGAGLLLLLLESSLLQAILRLIKE